MSKAYFIGGAYMGCWYARCYTPMVANGWKGNYIGLSKSSLKDAKRVTKEALEADVIVFHRANNPVYHKLGMLLRSQGKKIVFDNDDTYIIDKDHAFYGLDERGFEENKIRLQNVVNNFILNADLVTTSTKVLAEEYRKINPNVVVLPNYVNPDDWSKPLKNEGNKVRIGLVGSTAYYQDFQVIKKVISKLDKRKDVQIVLFGLWNGKKRENNPLVEKVHKKEFKFWDSLKNKEHVPWCEMEEYFYQLNHLKLDLMLIPRQDNYFNTCKSNIKFLEASMLEIPVIASDFKDGPYQELDGNIGVLATNDWEEKIDLMIENKELRREIGRNAHNFVLANYNIKDHAHLWADNYSKLCQKK